MARSIVPERSAHGHGSRHGQIYIPSPARTRSAASLRAAAQSEESFGFFPFAARVAFVPAFLSAAFALFRSFSAFLAGLVAAWSMRSSALVSFALTPVGMVWPVHAAPVSAAPRTQRAVMQGSVVDVVVPPGMVEVVVETDP